MLADADFKDATPPPDPFPLERGGDFRRMFLPPDFPELELYALFRSRICRPNGPMTICLERQQGDPDAPFKWDFLFVPCGELNLQIIRGAGGIEAWWWGQPATEAEILSYLKNNLERYQEVIQKEISGLERHTLILNPYVRHRNIAEIALDELNQIHPTPPKPIVGHVEQGVLDEHVKQMNEYMAAVERQASLTLLVVTESAFMAEAYLNLMLAFMMKKEVRASKSIMTETLMRKWKAKIERLHIDCIAIPEAANMGDARVGRAKTMFDIRNRVAHSYPDREEMAVGKVWFDDCFPVLERNVSFMNFTVTLHNQLPSAEEARFCKKAADELIEFLTDLVDPRLRKQHKFVSETNPLGYNENKGMYSVPFGRSVIMSITTSAVPNADVATEGVSMETGVTQTATPDEPQPTPAAGGQVA